MAKNIVFEDTVKMRVVVDSPASPVSGDVCRVGDRVGIAETDKSAVDGKTTVKFRCAANVSVKGVNGSGNSAVAVNDVVFFVDADTPPLSKKTSGTRAGIALATVGSGSTATILVLFG